MKIVKRIKDIKSDIGLPNRCPVCEKNKHWDIASSYTFVCDDESCLVAAVCSVKCAKQYIKEHEE